MSTILKALKKLEEEQRAGTPLPLDSRIVAGRGQPAAGRRGGLPVALGVAGGGVAALLAVAAWFWLQPPPAPPARQLPALAASGGSPLSAPPLQAKPVTPAPAPAGIPATLPAPRQDNPPPAPEASSPVHTPAASAPVPTVVSAPPPEATPAQVTIVDRQIPEPGRQWGAPHLSVTEIFAPSAGGEWMAVVNDLPVMAGTTVEGALVERIERDRVLFSLDGRQVAIPLAGK